MEIALNFSNIICLTGIITCFFAALVLWRLPAAAAGLPNLTTDLLKGYKLGNTTYKAHLDGYNQLDYWTGKTDKTSRREFFY